MELLVGGAAGIGAVHRPKLEIRELSKRYGAVTALEPSSLTIKEGEFLTLLGPSGSGKSTLLQLIVGLVEPSSGRVFIDGRDQTDLPVHKRDVGMVFQNYALFPHLSVGENVAFPLRMRGMNASAISAATLQALDMVKMAHCIDRLPRELSGGQQQRIALARCFVYRPSIILLDEPLGALDKKLREHMQIEIMRLHRQLGTTMIYVTHDQEEALAMSDRICLMNNSNIVQIDSPEVIYRRPRSVFAASFIGQSNIFRGSVVRGDRAAPYFVSSSYRFPVHAPAHREGGPKALVIRPEHIRFSLQAGDCAVEGRVRETIFAGSSTKLLVDIGAEEALLVHIGGDASVPSPGELVKVGWDPRSAVLLDDEPAPAGAHSALR